MIANLKHAARNHEIVRIGGGLFAGNELLKAAATLEAAPDLLAALQAIADAEPAKDVYTGDDGWRLAHEKFAAFARAAIAKVQP